jgi:hypothetical protein
MVVFLFLLGSGNYVGPKLLGCQTQVNWIGMVARRKYHRASMSAKPKALGSASVLDKKRLGLALFFFTTYFINLLYLKRKEWEKKC